MKKEDKYIMQITTIHKIQNAFDTSMKALKFIWRHAFVLIVFGMMVTALVIGRISWENCIYLYAFAAFADWCKTPSKSSTVRSVDRDNIFDSARRNRNDFSWKMNPINPMGYTSHTYNSSNNY